MLRRRLHGRAFDARAGRAGRRRRVRIWAVLLATLVVVVPSLVGAQLYKWTDEQGRQHFSDDLRNVPERYRERMSILPSVKGDAPETPLPGQERTSDVGQYPAACEHLVGVLEKERGNPTLRQQVANCLELAVAHLQHLLQRDPSHAEGRRLLDKLELRLAWLYDQRDQTDLAVVHLQRLLQRDPSHAEGRRLLDKLERERRAEVGYWKDESDHFIVKYPGGELTVRRAVIEVLEEVYVSVGREFNYFPSEKITVILYPGEQFHEVTETRHWVGGSFDGKIRLPVGRLRGRTRALEQALAHEYTHAVVHLLGSGRAPQWLHEGLAQHAEGEPRNPDFKPAGEITLAGLEGLLWDPHDQAKMRMDYKISLRVVRDLLRRGGMERMRELLTRLGQGESAADAIPAVYGLPLADLEREWNRARGG